ncbi:MAG: energy-coupling factor transporter ATPase [Euzebyales bacterium]|nr:energy-coupling factor transporter ATPase [Euzebyales bacterium]
MISLQSVTHVYGEGSDSAVTALDGVTLELREGELTVLFGHNGCGKSTLARHCNGLLLPTSGRVVVGGVDTADDDRIYDVRQQVGMVFQNPDNQIVATIVEDDIGFGPENLGLDSDEIQRRVDEAVVMLGLEQVRGQAPHLLSGGQKQLVAIAGVLAMRPRIVVLDEPTSLLDPAGRAQVLDVALRLVRDEGLGVVLITHFMHEAVHADRVVVMDAGRVVLDGTPPAVFSQVDALRELQLDVPHVTRVADLLRREYGLDLPPDLLTVEQLVDAVLARPQQAVGGRASAPSGRP